MTAEKNVENFYLVIMFLLFFLVSSCFAASTMRNTRKTHRRLFNVTREYNSGDLFSSRHLLCHPDYCSKFGGNVAEQLKPCSCQCPINKPIFLQHLQNCTNNIDVCDKVLEFRSDNETNRVAPTLFLPLQNQILNPGAQLNWEEAGIKLNRKGRTPCSVQIGGILTEQGWVILHKKLFQLHVVNAGTFFKWLGNDDDSKYLEGKLVQIPIQCTTNRATVEHMCSAFRVMGNDVMPTHLVPKSGPKESSAVFGGGHLPSVKNNNDQQNETGLIVGVICAALLVFTLVGVAIFWVVCWKQQKDRIIRKVQMQFFYQQRFQHQNGTIFHTGAAYCPTAGLISAQNTAIEVHPAVSGLHLTGGNPYRDHP